MPRDLRWSWGGGTVSYERGTPVRRRRGGGSGAGAGAATTPTPSDESRDALGSSCSLAGCCCSAPRKGEGRLYAYPRCRERKKIRGCHHSFRLRVMRAAKRSAAAKRELYRPKPDLCKAIVKFSPRRRIGHIPGGERPLLREGGPISYELRPSRSSSPSSFHTSLPRRTE